MFKEAVWKFQPGVNILLGRNGYGKSLLFRTIAAAIQKDDGETEKKSPLFNSPDTLVEGVITRNAPANKETFLFQHGIFEISPGKIPLLAISDTRFINKAASSIDAKTNPHSDLVKYGAYHFLHQLPYS